MDQPRLGDAFRLTRVRQIQEQQGDRKERLRQLRHEIEALEAAEAALHQKFVRAQRYDPDQGTCPRCSIDDGETIRLIVVAGGTATGIASAARCPRCSWDESTVR